MDRGTETGQFLWVLYLPSQTLSLIPVLEKVPREQLEQEQRLWNGMHPTNLCLTLFHSDSLCSAAASLLLLLPPLLSSFSI